MESAQTTEKTNVTSHEDAQSRGSVNIEMTDSNDGLARENGQPDEGEGRIDRSRTPLRKVRFQLSKPALSIRVGQRVIEDLPLVHPTRGQEPQSLVGQRIRGVE